MAQLQSFKHRDRYTQALFKQTYQILESLLTADARNLRFERIKTTSITTTTADGNVFRGQQQITFTRAFSATPDIQATGLAGSGPVWAAVKNATASSATVYLFSAAATRTGKAVAWVYGK